LSSTLLAAVVVLVAAALAAASYFVGGRPDRALWPAVVARAVSWCAITLLLLDTTCATGMPGGRPLVLLDTSASFEVAGGQATLARRVADSLGEVREFPDSRLLPALTAAAASGRPVIVVTDGELIDGPDLPADLVAGATARVLPRTPRPDLALTRVEAPRRLASGDSLRLQVELRAIGDAAARPVRVEARAGERLLGQATVSIGAGATIGATIDAGVPTLPPGEHLIEVIVVDAGDDEPRTDRRLHVLTVTPTPGIVLVASPAGWESRFLYQALADVSALPVQGYLMLEPGSWRRMRDLQVVGAAVVQQAMRGADLLVTLGATPAGAEASRARGRWEWPDASPLAGDWYLTPADLSPLASAFAGIPTDSLPPATALAALEPPAGGWVGLTAQAGRRGVERVAVTGAESGGQRRIVVGASGMWRWAFRGGAAEQAYRAWVAASVTWLLARSDSAGGSVRPLRTVVERGDALHFEWTGSGAPTPLPITLASPAGGLTDTLAFDGSGRAALLLPPGAWRYTTPGGGHGLVAVEEYTREFLPARVTLASREATVTPAQRTRGTRELLWLFGLAVLAWCVEWGVRRRAGMR